MKISKKQEQLQKLSWFPILSLNNYYSGDNWTRFKTSFSNKKELQHKNYNINISKELQIEEGKIQITKCL